MLVQPPLVHGDHSSAPSELHIGADDRRPSTSLPEQATVNAASEDRTGYLTAK